MQSKEKEKESTVFEPKISMPHPSSSLCTIIPNPKVEKNTG